jgi:hypothetical protein
VSIAIAYGCVFTAGGSTAYAFGDWTPTFSVTIDNPSDGAILSSANVTVSGTAADETGILKVEISKDGADWIHCGGATSWSGDLSLNEGLNTIYAKATNTLGNTTTASINITVDLTKPSITITSPSNGTVLSYQSITVTGTASDSIGIQKVKISRDDTNWVSASGTTTWSGILTLNAGLKYHPINGVGFSIEIA